MTKSLSIKETGTAKTLSSIRYVDTAKYGGGDVRWVEKSDAKLIKKTVRKKGTFKAAKDGAYGYSQVTVKIKGLKEAMHKGMEGEITDAQSGITIKRTKPSNITIQEGNIGKTLTNVFALEIPTTSGEYSTWMAESNLELKEKTVKNSGTFYAFEDNAYGFSEFTVEIDKESHTGDDGNEYVDDVVDGGGDEGGDEVVEKLVPSSIKIETLPSKVDYKEGDEIDLTGIVVKAYCGDGNLWESEGYEGGIIPIEELEVEPQEAEAKGTKEVTTDWSNIPTSQFAAYAWTKYLSNPLKSGSGFYYWWDNPKDPERRYKYYDTKDQRVIVISNGTHFHIYVSSRHNKIFREFNGVEQQVQTTSVSHAGETFYVYWDTANPAYVPDVVETPELANYVTIPDYSWNTTNGNHMFDMAKIMWSGDRTIVGNEETVSWGRPEDGKELKDKFNINVT